jgi:methyltransferase-like protein/2-polyprenyl-3-methyl-5-hydroxy-6-metoxy-1,4-benzoquinol methylase
MAENSDGIEIPGNSYDRIPYKSYPFSDTHPDRLASVGRIFKLETPPLDTARVLELGSSSGGNIIPLAVDLPRAKFVGIDLSSVEIGLGKQVVERLQLTNIELKHANILDVTESWGQFDYIICHGVFSWVPTEVRDHILRICSERLTPNGLAYVSYNCYPGWHMMNIVRDMMLFHAGRFNDPQTQIAQARSLLNFMARWVPAKENPFGDFIRREAENFLKRSDFYLYHEHLEDINEPMYFCEFVELARKFNLEYVGETHVGSMLASRLPDAAREALQVLAPDLVTMEQYLDFLRNRTFRRTILCHKGRTIDRNIGLDRLEGMFLSGSYRREEGPEDLRSKEPTKYRGHTGSTVSTPEPVLKATFEALTSAWPGGMPVEELGDRVAERLKLPPAKRDEAFRKDLCRRMITCYLNDAVELSVHQWRATGSISALPIASPIARLQAESGNEVTTVRHTSLRLPPEVQIVLPLMDGSRDHATLAAAIAGKTLPGPSGKTIPPEKARQTLNNCLSYIARNALLIG